MIFDCIVIGGGPGGCSAALTLLSRGKSVAVVSLSVEDIPLSRSERVSNYPGCPDISGKALLEAMRSQTEKLGAVFIRGHANAVAPMGDTVGVSVDADFYEAKTVILCTGVGPGAMLPGEREYLGRGVSYCVTCDGMLYRGRNVAVLGFTADAEAEAETLRAMGCTVELFTAGNARYAVLGGEKVTALSVNGEEHLCDAVFILRSMSAPDTLVPGLELSGRHIRTDSALQTSVKGIFAAGDCIGRPYQVAKAVGEGNMAALSAAACLDEKDKENDHE